MGVHHAFTVVNGFKIKLDQFQSVAVTQKCKCGISRKTKYCLKCGQKTKTKTAHKLPENFKLKNDGEQIKVDEFTATTFFGVGRTVLVWDGKTIAKRQHEMFISIRTMHGGDENTAISYPYFECEYNKYISDIIEARLDSAGAKYVRGTFLIHQCN